MALIEYTMEGKIDKVKIAIDRIRAFDPLALGIMPDPYYVAYSGGKDSDVLRILFELSGVRHDLFHNHTSIDAPETVRYIRTIPGIIISPPRLTMWQLIVKNKMPPTRIRRYCCTELKERGGQGRFVATGVRWEESPRRRKQRGGVEVKTRDIKKQLILNADNDESRRMIENCQLKGKRILNPIIDWSEKEVWEFLRHYGCESNPLYAEGFRRIGCIGCPMSSRRAEEFRRWPTYKRTYIHTFGLMLQARVENPILHTNEPWRTKEEVFKWWMEEGRSPLKLENGAIQLLYE